MKRFLPKIASLLLVITLFTAIHPPLVSAAWGGKCVSEGDVPTLKGFECLFANVLVVLIQLVGVVMLLMIFVGGFKYLTAGGNPETMASARGTLTLAIAGLVLAILAWFILVFISTFTGVDLTTFTVGIGP